MTPAVDDDARWAEALSLLEGTPTESGRRTVRRLRRLRLLLVIGITVVTVAVVLVVVLLARPQGFASSTDVSVTQEVVGLVVNGLGVVVVLVALALQIRANRRNHAWRAPTSVLTRQQRKQLVAQIRGRSPVVEHQLPLTRHVARVLVSQRVLLVFQLGILLSLLGQWITRPRGWWLAVVVGFGVLVAVGWVLMLRETRRAQRFLEGHPSGGDR